MGESVVCLGETGLVVYANAMAKQLLEYSGADTRQYSVANLVPEASAGLWPRYWEQARREKIVLETILRTASGRLYPVEVTLSHLGDDSGELAIALIRDISQRKHSEAAMKLAAAIYMSSNEAVMVTNEHNHVIQVNPAFTSITDYTLDDLYGKRPAVFWSDLHDEAFYHAMWKDIRETGHWQGEMWGRRKTGESFASHITFSLIRNQDGSVFGYVAQFLEITEKKRRDEIIWRHANYDTLTALPNRRLFEDRLEQEIKKSVRTGLALAVLFIDLDGFKQVNDQLGHDKGDLLLVEAAGRIRNCVRETDTVARLGGDEFTIILPNYGGRGDVERIANSIVGALQEPIILGNDSCGVGASIGIAIFPDDAGEVEALMRCADHAMYAAKKNGRCGFSHASDN